MKVKFVVDAFHPITRLLSFVSSASSASQQKGNLARRNIENLIESFVGRAIMKLSKIAMILQNVEEPAEDVLQDSLCDSL